MGPAQVGDRLWQRGRRVSQLNGDRGLAFGDVVDGEADDAADGLRIEENESGGDPGLLATAQESAPGATTRCRRRG